MASDLRGVEGTHVRNMDAEYHALRLKLAEKMLLKKAEDGELWAIQNLLLLVSDAIADGVPLSPLIASYISSSLRKIHDGEKADDAFGIKRKRGEKDTRRSQQRAFSMADAIERLRYHDKLTLEKAIAFAATKFSVSEDSVKRNWKAHNKEVKRLMELELDNFGIIHPVIWVT